jgi:hypothetical protein
MNSKMNFLSFYGTHQKWEEWSVEKKKWFTLIQETTPLVTQTISLPMG